METGFDKAEDKMIQIEKQILRNINDGLATEMKEVSLSLKSE